MKTQISIMGLTLFYMLWSQIGLITQPDPENDSESGDEDDTESTPAQASTPAAPAVQDQERLQNAITIIHKGSYIAKFEVRYSQNGQEKVIEIGNKNMSYREVFIIPFGASNIQIKAWAMTGLVWAPWGQIYDMVLQPGDLNKCYTCTGTTLDRHWNNDC